MATKTIEKAYCPECGEEFGPETRNCPNDGSRLYSYQVRGEDDDPLLGGTIDDRFRVDEILGEGGMGRVYRGIQLSVERPVAIKVLRPELIEREDVIQRFLREARVISSFNHPNIVNLVEFGQDAENDILYLAMELLDGVPLADLLRRGRAHPNLVCEVGVQVCRALAEAHAREIVHRDLKPDNLMAVPMSDGSVQVKVLDFGIAHAVQGEKRLTSTGQVFGTAHYMAPEQASGKDVGPGTDIYALGCIFYEMLSGKLPFDAPSVMGLLVAHVQQPPPDLREKLRDDDIPDELVGLTMQMLEKKPEDRPTGVLEVRDRLEKIRGDAGFGPVRIDPSRTLDRGLFLEWLRGEHSARLSDTSQPLDPATDLGKQHTGESLEALGTAETAAHSSAPSLEPPSFESSPGRSSSPGANDEADHAGSANPPSSPAVALEAPMRSGPYPASPQSDLSMEYDFATDHTKLYLLAAGLLVVVVVVAVSLVVVVTQSGEVDASSVAAEESVTREVSETTAVEEGVEATSPDPTELSRGLGEQNGRMVVERASTLSNALAASDAAKEGAASAGGVEKPKVEKPKVEKPKERENPAKEARPPKVEKTKPAKVANPEPADPPEEPKPAPKPVGTFPGLE